MVWKLSWPESGKWGKNVKFLSHHRWLFFFFWLLLDFSSAGWREKWCNDLACPTVILCLRLLEEKWNYQAPGIKSSLIQFACVSSVSRILSAAHSTEISAGRRKLHIHVNHCLHYWEDERTLIFCEMFTFQVLSLSRICKVCSMNVINMIIWIYHLGQEIIWSNSTSSLMHECPERRNRESLNHKWL